MLPVKFWTINMFTVLLIFQTCLPIFQFLD